MIDSVSMTGATVDTEATGLIPFEPRVGMVSYRVADIERSLRFYIGVLGMRERLRLDGFGPDERELVLEYPGNQGAVVMLMWNIHRTDPYHVGDGYSRVTIIVNDVRGALKHLVDHGTPVVVPAMELNNVLFAVVTDPDGYMIELLQLGPT